MARYLLGIDLGTSAVKTLLVSPDDPGRNFSDTVDLTLNVPHPGWSEQDPQDWWSATSKAVRGVLQLSGVDPGDLAGIGVSGQMHGAVLLDSGGGVLRPAILWNDQRSGAECEFITESIGLEKLLGWVGNPALAGFTAPKLLWVRRHEPEVFEGIATLLLPKDYVNYRLTGALATEPSDASGTLLYDVAHDIWSGEALDALQLSRDILPKVHASTDVVGHVNAKSAGATGLKVGTPVVAGGADNACAAVGAGVVLAGEVLVSLGTSGTVVAPTAQTRVDPHGRLHSFRHAVPGMSYLMGVVLSAGGSLHWLRDVLGDAVAAEGRDPYDLMTELAAWVPPGSEGLIFLPYLTGERTPHGDPTARGGFIGLTRRHAKGHMIRSVLEGVSYALNDSAQLIRSLGVTFDEARMTGGGSRSQLWREIVAAVLNCTITTTGGETGPALGAAILAGAGTGVFRSVEEGVELLVAEGDETQADPDLVKAYAAFQPVYDELYPALKPIWSQLDGSL